MGRRSIADKYEGKWRGILQEAGVPEKFLRNHQGPCPLCGGKDRFRFDDKGKGMYYCNQCGPGDGPMLIQKFTGMTMSEVLRRVEQLAGRVDNEPFEQEVDVEKRRRNLNRIWQAARRPGIAKQYLEARGLRPELLDDLKTIRGTGELWDRESNTRMSGVVSLVQDKKGRAVTLHRIFIGYGKRWKKLMPPLGTITGAAIRLGEPHDWLSVCEGVESGLAIRQMTEGPVWCGISAHGMETMELPNGLTRLDIWADSDDSFTGQKAAYTLANRYWRGNRSCQVSVIRPSVRGNDPLDLLVSGDDDTMIDRGGE